MLLGIEEVGKKITLYTLVKLIIHTIMFLLLLLLIIHVITNSIGTQFSKVGHFCAKLDILDQEPVKRINDQSQAAGAG